MSAPCYLEPINLQDADQLAELLRQRVLCGWDHTPEKLQQWKTKQAEGLKSLFWITTTNSNHNNNNHNGENESILAGHISLDAYSDPPDAELARADKSVLAIQTFFILPEYRALRLGRRAMDLAERMAVQEPYGSPNCSVMALTALSKRYMYDEGPEGRGFWDRIGMPMPEFSIQEWYEKLGYVGWKEEPRYQEKTVDGGVVWLWEVFMRKELKGV
ncbi:hypothetical protein EYZ11_012889 [Aspergillus tanneri]|uniref:N-acetyltransferase domain-containing protein n=1 Tax=Aspergillus tanneri TaxID=1220188 RepID=A0A4V3UMK5_9EURO|nr:uncharacterized protein ATNIH1004_010135 [Aspergillus tanneri]KAA8643366.1 hypothetical protein ATNIH1004_010135 [Aspergillus tanneri]THC87664.1 hypothetical protein EYZ11_012889 [Aspergillus tanneri]